TTQKVGSTFSGFEKTDTYAWLTNNAYQYGFILSYPKGNTYYEYEPWHWRYVGVDLATKLHDEGKNFYDLDQREINGYLISFYN
ncbi:MAG: peptidase and DD-carboxypeptidase VanY/endolysin, partial [Parcubacteria group bacterium]|nr:peptidase and DD-carboxypeptidase VanY/endolysin [Parcubacteria group bacterium]